MNESTFISPSTSKSTFISPSAPVLQPRINPVLVRDIFETLTSTESLGAKLEAIAASVCAHLEVSFVAILLEHSRGDRLLIEGSAGLSSGYIASVNARHKIPFEPPHISPSISASSEAFRTGKPVIVPDTETDPHARGWRALFQQQGIRSFISVPLRSHGVVIGTLNCYHQSPRTYSDDDVQTLRMVAAQVGIAVEIGRLVDAQQQTIKRLEELTQHLNEQHALLEHAARIQTSLTQLVLNNQGIPAIAATLARVVHSPIVVQDQFYQVIAASDATGTPCDLAPVSRDMLAIHSSVNGDKNPRAPFELEAMPKRGLDRPRAVAPILSGRQLLGYVSLELAELPTPPLTARALAQAANVVALEMVKDRLAHEVELRQRRGFADDLLSGRYDDPVQMRDRGRYLGHDLRGPFQVLAFDIDQFGRYVAEHSLSDSEIDTLRRRFLDALLGVAKALSPHAIVAGRHDQLALILSAMNERGHQTVARVLASVEHACRQSVPDLTISAGVGKPYPELTQIPTSYTEASRALQVIRRLNARGKTMTYADLGITRLIFQVENPAELLEFAHTRMGPVLAYDERHDGVLMAALEGYLRANQSVQDAALQLDLHPNTLRYRLRKVSELLGAPLTDIDVLLDLQLACLILRLVDN
ncbi:MAG TPA: GAF domain-containing protein [Ktedonobacterales bacterium]|nr:GAF domain-containing protein [Ktedonobacterales bacterium]